jgi:hypothetical protein
MLQNDGGHGVLGDLQCCRMMEATVFLGTFNAAEMFWYHSPDLCLDRILSQSSTDNSFNLSTVNIPQLVGLEDGTVLVESYGWQQYPTPYFRPLTQQYQHAR